MHCPRCGVVIPDDEIYCTNCGYLEEIVVPEVVRAKIKVEARERGKLYAGFWKRLAAGVLDFIFLIFGEVVIIALMMGLLWVANLFLKGQLTFSTIWGFFMGFGLMLSVALNWAYFTMLESSFMQATFGKMILGIRVTDLDKRRITFGRANKRYWLKIVAVISLFLGIIMMAISKNKQGFHDLIAETLVISEKPPESKAKHKNDKVKHNPSS